jgi:hypothetical protein
MPGRVQFLRMRRTLLALIAALALLGGCAGEKKEGVATAGDVKTSTSSEADQGDKGDKGDIAAQSAKFAQCMRDNGVDMPDPQVDGDGRVRMGGPAAGAADRDKAKAAHEKCKQHLPNGGEPPKLSDEDLDKMRKFSQCMRENGYPDFPDPQPEGGIRIENNGNSDMDPESQKWKDAHAKCEQHMPTRPGDGGRKNNTDGGS